METDEIREHARCSTLGKLSRGELAAIALNLGSKIRGSKAHLIERIHIMLGIPFDLAKYHAVGMTAKPVKAPPPLAAADVINKEADAVNVAVLKHQQNVKRRIREYGVIDNAAVKKQKVLSNRGQVDDAIWETIESFKTIAYSTIQANEASTFLHSLRELHEKAGTTIKQLEELNIELEEIDDAAREMFCQKSHAVILCPICLDETKTRFERLDPCGHIVCSDCVEGIKRGIEDSYHHIVVNQRCPKCRKPFGTSHLLYI